MTHYPNGVGGSLGDTLVTCRPLFLSGNVWYVHHTGVNGGSPAGRNRETPLQTLAQAHTNAAAGDVIVCIDGHTETLTANLALNKAGITIVGEGSSAGKPTVKLTMNAAATIMFSVSGAGVKLRNLWFEENLQSNSGARLSWSGADGEVRGCYFECGGFDGGYTLSLGGGSDSFRLFGSTFVSTAVNASGPPPASAVRNALAIADLDIIDCVFDGGQYGWAYTTALDLTPAAVTRLRIENLTLLRGADFDVHASSIGYINVQTASGGIRGSW